MFCLVSIIVTKKIKEHYIINLIILLAKFHTHKSTFSKSEPSFIIFEHKTKQYIKTIFSSENQKAIKTVTLCTSSNVFIKFLGSLALSLNDVYNLPSDVLSCCFCSVMLWAASLYN